MAADEAEKTEEPTPKRIEEARRRGEVANSRDLSAVVVLTGALVAIGWFGVEAIGGSLAEQARAVWGGSEIRPETLGDFHALLLHHMKWSAVAMLPVLGAVMLAGLGVSLAQTGPLFASQALAFRGSRLSPIKGLKRLVDPDRLVDLAKAPLKLGVVAVAVALGVWASRDGLFALVSAPLAVTLETLERLTLRVAGGSLAALAILAALDLAYVQLRYRKRLRMSPREVRDELREREGSPQLRSRRRQVQRDLSRQRMIAEVARADVVVTNPTHYAVALRYVRAEMDAPRVVAKGRNELALRIRRVARDHDVPIVENPPIARVLYRTARVGRAVPEHLFQAVAEVLAHVYRLDRSRGAAWGAQA